MMRAFLVSLASLYFAVGAGRAETHALEDALAAQQRGDYAAAIALYREVVKANPALVPALVNLGISLVQAGRFAEAIDSYQSALAIDPKNQHIQFYLALAYFKSGNATGAAESARMDFSDADRIDDDELNAVLWRAIRKSDPPTPARSYYSH